MHVWGKRSAIFSRAVCGLMISLDSSCRSHSYDGVVCRSRMTSIVRIVTVGGGECRVGVGSADKTAFRLHSFGVKWKGGGSRSHCGPGIVIEALRPYGCVVVVRRVRRETVDDIDDPISNYPILSSSVGWWT